MPLEAKPIAMKCAVLAFFGLGIAGMTYGLSPGTCCARACVGAIIAYIVMQVGNIGLNPWIFFAVTVLPHGILELPAAIIATAQAMRMGDVILTPPNEGGGVNGIIRELGHLIKLFVAVVLPLLLIAAWVEAEITPRLLISYLSH